MILSAQRALDKIRKGTLAPGYLLLGQGIYWRDRIWSALRRAMGFDGSMTGLEEFDLRQGSLEVILARAAERSLWTPRQLILVRNAQALSGAKPLESLRDYFRDPSPTSILGLEMLDVDLEGEDWREKEKIKSRQEHWAELCEVVLLLAPPLPELLELVRREAAERGRKITPQAAEALIAELDGDLGRITQEIEKLGLYTAESEEISQNDVAVLVGSRESSGAGSLIEAIGSGDAASVLKAFDELIPKGAYLPLVVADLARYLRQLLLLQESKVRDPREASRMLWSARLPAPQALVPELLRQARAFLPEHLTRSLQEAFEADLALRSSPADERLILERYLLDLARPLRAKRPPAPA